MDYAFCILLGVVIGFCVYAHGGKEFEATVMTKNDPLACHFKGRCYVMSLLGEHMTPDKED